MGSNGFRDDVIAILQEAGCEFVKQGGKGSHEIWRSQHSDIYFTVQKKILSRHTANKVTKDAGLGKRF